MTRIRPRRGVILAGIPAAGADVDAELAREWERNGLVVIEKPKAAAKAAAKPPATPAKEG